MEKCYKFSCGVQIFCDKILIVEDCILICKYIHYELGSDICPVAYAKEKPSKQNFEFCGKSRRQFIFLPEGM